MNLIDMGITPIPLHKTIHALLRHTTFHFIFMYPVFPRHFLFVLANLPNSATLSLHNHIKPVIHYKVYINICQHCTGSVSLWCTTLISLSLKNILSAMSCLSIFTNQSQSTSSKRPLKSVSTT